MSLLAVDIGRGTQDILVFEKNKPVENSTKFVLPSPNVVVAGKIGLVTRQKKPLFLSGAVMGGGANVQAIARHLRAGLPVYATPAAAATIHDSLSRVTAMGITITDTPPWDAAEVVTTDYMERELREMFAFFGIPYPNNCAFALQDHGFSPEKSNRVFRFEMIKSALMQGDWQISALIHDPPLPGMSRMHALRDQAPGALVIDTGPAAILGALCDPSVRKHQENGVVIVNAGNGHTLGVSVKGEEIYGIFEHHTATLDRDSLHAFVRKLCNASLTGKEIFNEGGHGAVVHRPLATECIAATGPNRRKLLPDVYQAAPFGDMMLSGSFGIISAWKRLRGMLP
ncbi:MAG: DUF1786 domain-containing protein [Methanomicrobiales archaeon]|nr:DUF1786 domain-containing protein [Methanomicrobiales archaeon]